LLAPGRGGDYFGSREYVPGMPVRRWDYSSWARLGQPVVRELADPQQPTAAIVVDTCLPLAAKPAADGVVAELEATLSLAAALSDALTAQGHQVVLLAVGGEMHDLSSAGPLHQHDMVLRRLAEAKAAPEDSLAALRTELQSMPLPEAMFVLLGDWNAARDGLCEDVLLRGCALRRIFVGERAAEKAKRTSGDVVTSIAEIEAGGVEIS
jgi:uncharacterized protein (DUF58 family)